MSVRFVCCVEAGRLEGEALLLCESLRRFGGRFATAPIVAYSPRAGDQIPERTRAELERLDVAVVEDELNTDHAANPIANKLYAGADVERRFTEEVVVVLDSDTVFLGEPELLDLAPGTDAAVSAVGKVSEGTTGPGHENEEYWRALYELAGVTEPPWVETALRGTRIRGFWNSGLVAARRAGGILGEWLELFRLLASGGRLPPSGRIDNLDQIALALALSRRPARVATLPWPYNYRITRRGRYRGAARRAQLDELVHVHYMRSFYVDRLLERIDPPLELGSEQARWLRERLPLEPRVELGDTGPLTSRRIRRALGPELRRQALELPPER